MAQAPPGLLPRHSTKNLHADPHTGMKVSGGAMVHAWDAESWVGGAGSLPQADRAPSPPPGPGPARSDGDVPRVSGRETLPRDRTRSSHDSLRRLVLSSGQASGSRQRVGLGSGSACARAVARSLASLGGSASMPMPSKNMRWHASAVDGVGCRGRGPQILRAVALGNSRRCTARPRRAVTRPGERIRRAPPQYRGGGGRLCSTPATGECKWPVRS